MPVSVPDQIQKSVLLKAPLGRVWKALTDSKEFGEWFGVKFEGPFVAGTPVRGVIKPTTADLEVAKMQQPYVGRTFDITVDRIEPQEVSKAAASLAAMIYVVADMPQALPK